MNKDIIEGKWTQFKGELQKTWGKITGDEFEKSKGDMKSISGLVQERYGMTKDEADRKISEMSSKYSEKASGVIEKAKDALNQSNEKHRN